MKRKITFLTVALLLLGFMNAQGQATLAGDFTYWIGVGSSVTNGGVDVDIEDVNIINITKDADDNIRIALADGVTLSGGTVVSGTINGGTLNYSADNTYLLPLYLTSAPNGVVAYYTAKNGGPTVDAYSKYLLAAVNIGGTQTNMNSVRNFTIATSTTGLQYPFAYLYRDANDKLWLVDGAKHSIAGATRTLIQNRYTIDGANEEDTGEPVGDYVMGGALQSGNIQITLRLSNPPVLNVTKGDYYNTIQEAIDDAANNDVIALGTNTFEENIVIDKPLTLQAASTPVIDGGGNGVVVTISANNVTLDGLTIQNGGQSDPDTEAGVLVYNSGSDITNVTIQNCTVQNNASGIGIVRGIGHTIQHNVIKDNIYGVGIVKESEPNPSADIVVFDNEIYNCAVGVYVDKYCAGNEIEENEIYGFTNDGIYLWATQNNIVKNNTITGANTPAKNGNSSGIQMAWGSGHEITGNVISACDYGIQVRKRVYTGNLITHNSITESSLYGLIFHDLEIPGGDTETVIAECNWWGTTAESEIEAQIEGDVVFFPWLLSDDLENIQCWGGAAYNVRLDKWYESAQDAIDDDDAEEGDEIKIYYDAGELILGGSETGPVKGGNNNKHLNIHYLFNIEPEFED